MRRTVLALMAVVTIGLWTSGEVRADEPYGAIGEKYVQLGGRGGALGPAIGRETDAPYGGRFHLFKEGIIYWHPETGAYAVWGAIAAKYWELGRTEYGYPITDESVTPDGRGRYNHFRAMHLPDRPESSIYWTPETGAHPVYGGIRDAWARAGWERSEIGYPTSGEFPENGGVRQNFERGYILWMPQSGARIVKSGSGLFNPPQAMASHLVRGIEVALNGQRIDGDANFLSENTLCGAFNAARPDLEQYAKDALFAHGAPLIRPFGLHPEFTHVRLSSACTFRAEVMQACADAVRLRTSLPRNLIEVQITTPGIAPEFTDPELLAQFDLEVETVIQLPRNGSSPIGLGPSKILISNARLDSDNVTGDLAVAVARLYDLITKQNLFQRLSDTHKFEFAGLSARLSQLSPAMGRIPSNYRVDSCMTGSDILRLNGTDRATAPGPIVN